MRFLITAVLTGCFCWSQMAQAEYRYYPLAQPILTHYHTASGKLRYLRVSTTLMYDNKADKDIIEQHLPLIRDSLITVIRDQKAQQIEQRDAKKRLEQESLKQLTQTFAQYKVPLPVDHVLFTQYHYQ